MHGRRPYNTALNYVARNPSRPADIPDAPGMQQASGGGGGGDAEDHEAQAKLLKQLSRRRNCAVWSHALVVFNVLGIPLSQGAYLEYTFTTYPVPLSSWALAIGFQYLFMFSAALPVGCLYVRAKICNYSRTVFFFSTLLAFGAQLSLQWAKGYVPVLINQGIVTPLMLGMLGTLSTLELSAHYKYNIPLVSMQSHFAGFAGAVVYTLIARQTVSSPGRAGSAHAISSGVLVSTLLIAWLLSRPLRSAPPQGLPKFSFPRSVMPVLREKGTPWFTMGIFFIFMAVFVFPTYITLLRTQPPALHPPETAIYALLATLASAALAAPVVANPRVRRLVGPVDMLAAAAIFAGSAALLPSFVYVPGTSVVDIVAGVAYGIGFAAILTLYTRASASFLGKHGSSEDMPARMGLIMVVAGLGAFGGVLGSAVLLEGMGRGERVVMCIAAGGLVLGGILVGVGRWRVAKAWNAVI